MVTNFREVTITGTSRPRARAINISNEYNEAPVAIFLEEKCCDIGYREGL